MGTRSNRGLQPFFCDERGTFQIRLQRIFNHIQVMISRYIKIRKKVFPVAHKHCKSTQNFDVAAQEAVFTPVVIVLYPQINQRPFFNSQIIYLTVFFRTSSTWCSRARVRLFLSKLYRIFLDPAPRTSNENSEETYGAFACFV